MSRCVAESASNFFSKMYEYLAKLQARSWLSVALSSSFSSALARREKCTRQHWRRQGGGAQGAQAPPIAGQNFLVKIEGLSSLPPAKSGRACYDNPTGMGYFYQMSNMYTCIAYLTEIRKFCSKNLVHKGVNFEAPNALKLTYEHL